MIEKLRSADSAVPAERAEVSVAFQIEAVLLDAHVTHAEPLRQLSDGQSLTSLKEIDNRKPLAAANLGDKTLHGGHSDSIGLRFRIGEVFCEKNLQKNATKVAPPLPDREGSSRQGFFNRNSASGGKTGENPHAR